MNEAQWNERFSRESYVYGESPNDFLRASAAGVAPGRALCIGEGEGRNAVFLAGLGWEVTAVDYAESGRQKALRLASKRGVSLDYRISDLATFAPEDETWDAVVSVFCHLPADVRRPLHQRLSAALRPGGVWIQEAYTPRQLGRGTGGPPVPQLLYEPADLREDLRLLHRVRCEELVREVVEGEFHTGSAAVVQVLARRH